MSEYDSTRWKVPVHDYSSMTNFLSSGLPSDGITRIGQLNNRVEFLTENLSPSSLPSATFFLVCFSGAMVNRANMTAPFFFGSSISRKLGFPLLALADPVISNNRNVTLAWYAGAADSTDNPQNIAAVIDLVAKKSGRIPLLIGGSGGGFAALNIMQHITVPTRAVIWNPQTMISAYQPAAVRNYVAAVCPAWSVDDDISPHEIMNNAGIQQDVREAYFKTPSCVLYLQNESDWHVQAHLTPFLAHGKWLASSTLVQTSPDRRVILGTGNWGHGHATPPPHVIESMIEIMTQDGGTTDPMDYAPSSVSRLLEDINIIVPDLSMEINATAILADGKVTVQLTEPVLSGDLTCAFYLMEHGVRAAQRWYTAEPQTVFDTAHTDPTNLSVVVFLRHGQGKPTIVTIPVTIQNQIAAYPSEPERVSSVPHIAIFGSSVSADAIFGRDTMKSAGYMARSSLASQIGSEHLDNEILDQLPSPFQRKTVKADMEKSIWDVIEAGSFDLMVIDFIDDRFDMLELPCGSIHTLSAEYVGAMHKLGRTVNPDKIIPKYSDRKWALWQQGWDRLAQTLSRHDLLDRLFVNKVFYAQQDTTGRPLEGHPFKAENEWLLRIYSHLENTCPQVRFLHYDPALFIADPDHKWGLSPFHYGQNFYDETIRQLLRA